VTDALTAGKLHVKRAIMVRPADVVHWPFAGTISMPLPFAKERQHASIIDREGDLTFCITAVC